MTADDVRAVVFDQAKMLARGYSEDQVDEFLDLVADSIEALTRKLADKQAEVNRLKHWREAQDATLRSGADTQADIDRILNDAQRNADAIVRRAHAVAERVQDEARARATHILTDASDRADLMVGRGDVGPDIAAAAVEVGTRIGGIRDALSEELANLYRLIGRVQNGGMGR